MKRRRHTVITRGSTTLAGCTRAILLNLLDLLIIIQFFCFVFVFNGQTAAVISSSSSMVALVDMHKLYNLPMIIKQIRSETNLLLLC